MDSSAKHGFEQSTSVTIGLTMEQLKVKRDQVHRKKAFRYSRPHAAGMSLTELSPKVCDVIVCMLAKQIIGHFMRFFEDAKTF
jgi:hypothetical protein